MTQTVLITGGSRGIGYGTAELFAQRGWNVVLCSRDENQAKTAAEKIQKQSPDVKILGIKTDVGDAASVDHLFDVIKNQFHTLEALVNNAGIQRVGDVFSLSDSDFLEMVRINIVGMSRCSKHAFMLMKKNGGSVVNISSLAGVQNIDKYPGLWAYGATKAAVIGLTEGLAVDGKPHGIRVNCIAPGATDTEMLRTNFPEYKALATPNDVAKVIYYLSDKEQSGILTGATIPIFSNS